MMMRLSVGAVCRLFTIAILALVFHVEDVSSSDVPMTSTSPNYDYQEPVVSFMTAPAELRRRQQTALSTCGFINGDASYPVSCQAGLYCAVTSTYVGCCSATNCRNIKTECRDALGAACDQSCQNNPAIQVCPSSLPYCALFQYEGGSVGIGCEAYPGLTSTVLLTVASGLSSLTTPTVDPYSTISGTDAAVATTTTSSAAASHSSSSGLSGGAIAGIVIGVVIGVALSAVGVWFAIRRSRKSNEHESEIANVSKPVSYKPVRDSALTELSSEAPSQPRIPETSSNPSSSNNWTSYNPAQAYVPGHHGREFSSTPEMVGELQDTSRPLSFPSTDATGSDSRR